MREIIIDEIKRLAKENGEAPGQRLFAAATSISEHQWRGKIWPRWSDALTEAGFRPNDWGKRLDTDLVLKSVAVGVRYFGKLPTSDELMLYRQSNPAVPSQGAIKRHLGQRRDIIAALSKLATDNPEFADIGPMLPSITPIPPVKSIGTKIADGHVYLIRSGIYHKIGRSDQLERRVKEIRIALPDKAELIHSIRTDDPPGIEGYWHRRFADSRANGEWFKLSAGDVAAFRKRNFQ